MVDIERMIGERLDALNGQAKALADYAAADAEERVRLRGLKPLRLPLVQATGANPFAMGGDTLTASGQGPVSPDLGFVWSLKDLTITGLTSGATPDRIQILWAGRVQWELNGNQYAQTWGSGQKIIHPGESISYRSVPGVTFQATGQIQAYGLVWNVPGEMQGKLY